MLRQISAGEIEQVAGGLMYSGPVEFFQLIR